MDQHELWLIRHGETEWSTAHKHTGLTDLALTATGRERADRLRTRLAETDFSLVMTSPLQRARETCELAGFSDAAAIEPNLREWDYGEYEGRTTVDIRRERPGWEIWRDGVVDGESVDAVGARADRVIERAVAQKGRVALFAHAHVLAVLAARWVGLEAAWGRVFVLDTASVSVLGYRREQRIVQRWNQTE